MDSVLPAVTLEAQVLGPVWKSEHMSAFSQPNWSSAPRAVWLALCNSHQLTEACYLCPILCLCLVTSCYRLHCLQGLGCGKTPRVVCDYARLNLASEAPVSARHEHLTSHPQGNGIF